MKNKYKTMLENWIEEFIKEKSEPNDQTPSNAVKEWFENWANDKSTK